MFCLVDGNNFYVSCERVFQPALRNKPVVVLSNNDGCVVSRSDEAKAIGIKMGEPYFKCKQTLLNHRAIVCSSNYTLYADISKRIVSILKTVTPDIEIYSIDESFLYFSGSSTTNYHQLGIDIKKKILQETGIPVGVGFGKSKTLAKIANQMAKKLNSGIVNIHDYQENKVLKTILISDIWGVGKGFSTRLKRRNIHNAYHIKHASLRALKAACHVHGERLKLELMGISAIPLVATPTPNKSIISSKSFGKKITQLTDLKGALTQQIARAAEKLRAQKLKVKSMHVFAYKNRFKHAHYRYGKDIELPTYSSATTYLTQWGLKGIEECFVDGCEYVKSGVILNNCYHEYDIQQSLLHPKATLQQDKLDQIMTVYDRLNQKWGKGTVMIASAHQKGQRWNMKQETLSNKCTTKWTDIPIIKI